MKASDLRIGNIVNRNGIVVNCDFMSIADCHKNPEQYEPIELTEEWLLKFGFEKERYNFYKTDGFSYCIEYYFSDNVYSLYIYTDGDWRCVVNEITYVHQLQNIYYSLTGEELK